VYADVVDAAALAEFDQGVQMGVVGMDPPVGEKSHQMKLAPFSLDPGKPFGKDRVAEEISLLDAQTDSGQVLIDDAPGSQDEMADLRVAHLPFRKPDIGTGCADAGGGKLRLQGIEFGGPCLTDGVCLTGIADAPSIENDQGNRPLL
jgi:hypothetical protein